jgi:hypothetical protein
MLDGIEETLDEIALGVECEVAVPFDLAVWFDFGGMTALTARTSRLLIKLSASYPLSARRALGSTWAASGSACVMS